LPPNPTLADLTAFRIGGQPGAVIDCHTVDQLIHQIRAADAAGRRLLVIGGGSNILAGEQLADLTVLRDRRTGVQMSPAASPTDSETLPTGLTAADAPVERLAVSGASPANLTTPRACPGGLAASEGAPGSLVRVEAQAGALWDGLVELTVKHGLAGLESLSGIPGAVGAVAVQNVGAYGTEVGSLIRSATVWDRQDGAICELSAQDLQFSYRDSILKRSITPDNPTPRWVVLSLVFELRPAAAGGQVGYQQVAEALETEVGATAPIAAIRQAVLAIRRAKGMVLDQADQDTWSAGSFFTNPFVTAEVRAGLPAAAPVFAAQGQTKVSAAWLIEQAGIGPGFKMNPQARAAVSSKHVLALTNLGGATMGEVMDLAVHIQNQVKAKFNVDLAPEPVLVNASA
jgi:UDP-N-acetylmuramate dehydrogenase